MPGYGYAAAAKSKITAWTQLIHDYLRGRATLARVYLLMDARHGLMAADNEILATLDQAAVSYQIVLTKSDRVTAVDLAARLAALQSALARHPAAYPAIIATAAETGAGIAGIARCYQPPAARTRLVRRQPVGRLRCRGVDERIKPVSVRVACQCSFPRQRRRLNSLAGPRSSQWR